MFSVIFCVILPDTEVFRFSHLCLPVSLLEPWLSYLPLCSPKAALSQGFSHHIVPNCFTASPFSTSDDWCHSSSVSVSGWQSTAQQWHLILVCGLACLIFTKCLDFGFSEASAFFLSLFLTTVQVPVGHFICFSLCYSCHVVQLRKMPVVQTSNRVVTLNLILFFFLQFDKYGVQTTPESLNLKTSIGSL